MPKAEVHVHLEGTIDVDDVVLLAREAGEELPRPPTSLFAFEDLADFLEFLDWTCGLVRAREQLAHIARAFASREHGSGVRYADVIVNPTHWAAWRDRLGSFLDALDAGFREAEEDGMPTVGLCVSLLRHQSRSEAAELVEWLLDRRHPRVVALSIDGNEAAAGRTGPRFAEAFTRAADGGLRRTVHAGESSGPEGVRDALDLLKAERIDHGVRASEDPSLVRELADRGVPLGVCPHSNVLLGLYADLRSHPIEELRRGGVRVSVNTDDPSLLSTRLEDEYADCATTFGWNDATIREVARTSIEASFCDEDTRRSLVRELADWGSAL